MDDVYIFLDKFLTSGQQIALLAITVGTMVMTQAFKNIYFGFFPERRKGVRKAILWLAALSFGMAGGYIGFLSSSTEQPLWFWIFSGVSSGGMAIGLFDLIINVIMPRLKKS